MNEDMISSSRETPLNVSVFPGMNFWWAIQSDNFPDVFPDGTLWAPLRGNAGQRVASWNTLHNVRAGDLVLHYSRPAVRGISRAAMLPEPAYPPPRGYKEPAETEGILILTDPVCEVNIPWRDVVEVLPWGQGPLTAKGTLNNGYFFNLDSEGALQLLQRAGLEISDDPNEGRHNDVSADPYLGGPSDRWTLGAVPARSADIPSRNSSWSPPTSSPARHAPRWSAWTPVTCLCLRASSDVMRCSSLATLSWASRASSKRASQELTRLGTGLRAWWAANAGLMTSDRAATSHGTGRPIPASRSTSQKGLS